MATIKVKFRASSVETKEGTLYYQVIHKRIARQIKTDYHIFMKEWDEKSSRIRINDFIHKERKCYLISLQERMNWDVKRIEKIISQSLKDGTCTADAIVEKFRESVNGQLFFRFMKSIIIQLKRLNKERTAETYTATLNSFIRFRENNDVPLDEINSNLMMEYEAYLKIRGIAMNTISFYNRILRAVYNRAVENGLTEQRYPFKYVYTGIDKTVKRAIPLKAIKKIKALDLSLNPSLDFARDMFLFSFYTRGMSFIDIAYLQKSNLKNGILTYCRRKTGQKLSIKWEKCMQEIVDKYNVTTTEYLLPIITNRGTDKRKQYGNALHLINHKLKQLAKMAGLSVALTTYVSRHAWASIAKDKNIPLSIISESMGHDSESTTQIYLTSLDNSVIDKANELILKEL
ncbi:tyrosine-type recombinase/integrase [Parabacteroides pacaensis]|uniref:tyrosine-type recombinase/integrase n=1 Tax=Parabacteroides pacaensis TaxID=2086575 RepID=UPI000D1023AE|nr:site-specific integrase [Parabacteroides pacaensis]